MNKSFCDHCGAEIKIICTESDAMSVESTVRVTFQSALGLECGKYDLCSKCFTEIKRWFKQFASDSVSPPVLKLSLEQIKNVD